MPTEICKSTESIESEMQVTKVVRNICFWRIVDRISIMGKLSGTSWLVGSLCLGFFCGSFCLF